MPAAPTIVPIGGAGFSPAILQFVLDLCERPRPRVCFVPTASGDSSDYVVRFYEAFRDLDSVPSHVALHGTPEREAVRRQLLDQDAIYVGGGNTANMLAVWRLHGADVVLREAWEQGIVLAGVSAGANCWFEASTTDSFGPLSGLRDGLGFLPGSFSPHYDAEPERRPTYQRLVSEGFPAGFAADDGVALHFTRTELVEAVAAGAGSAFRVEPGPGGTARETALDLRRLG